ncbi:MAG: CoA pyrophosphatase [Nitrospira sp.]|nr:CoA pyrophosphatase [Nitrospira sp.]
MLTIEHILKALAKPLPGLAGQLKMAPQPTTTTYNRRLTPEDCREAGVLLLLYPHLAQPAEFYIVFIRRPTSMSAHSGQISFPGGRREANETLEATAIRETTEELGIVAETLEVIGRLSSLYTPPSNFCIYPFVAFSPTRPNFQPNVLEVAELIEAPLSLLLEPQTRKEEIWYFENFGERQIPFFDLFGHKVWGATAMILSEFLTLLGDWRLEIGDCEASPWD